MNTEELASALRRLHAERNAELERRFDRNLSFADGLFDRWERAAHLGFEEGASIYDSALVFGRVAVGANTWIGPYTLLDGSGGGIEIGSWCSISTGVQIYTHDSVHRALSGGLLPQRKGAVSIGDRSYVGSQSIVALGTRIGDMCVVAANSFVNSDVPERTVVGGESGAEAGERRWRRCRCPAGVRQRKGRLLGRGIDAVTAAGPRERAPLAEPAWAG